MANADWRWLVSLAATDVFRPGDAPAIAQAKPTFASVLNSQLSGVEGELVPAAEALGADKYSFAPTQGEFKGVRNFGSQVKHRELHDRLSYPRRQASS